MTTEPSGFVATAWLEGLLGRKPRLTMPVVAVQPADGTPFPTPLGGNCGRNRTSNVMPITKSQFAKAALDNLSQ
jgi:hypothetical protein